MRQRVTGLLALYTVTVTVALVGVCMWAASGAVEPVPIALRAGPRVWSDGRQNDMPAAFVAALPEKRAPRVLLLGASQMNKPRDGGITLAARLGERMPDFEIIDFSAGGQQIVESVALLEGAQAEIRPDVVVIGVSLFAAIRAVPRESIATAFRKAPAVEKNFQTLADEKISAWLAEHIDAIGRRREIYQALVETPLRRDLRRRLEHVRPGTTAQTFPIGPAYIGAAEALRRAVRFCDEREISLVLVDLPFDDSREPRPFLEADRELFSGLLRELGERGAQTLDASHLLSREHFGEYQDGSPDGLHFDGGGQDRVVDAISTVIQAMAGSQHAL